MKSRIILVTAVLISSQVLAQQDSARSLDEVVITATKTPLKQSQTGKVVSVVDRAMLERNSGRSLTEILNYQAGMFINGANNSPGTNQDNYLRGAATGNTLILMDGIPVGDPSQINNSFDLNNINPEQVERIEILKGAQSTLWGSDAVAGVINIITRKGGASIFSPSAGLSYGSYGTVKANAGISGQLKKFSYNLHYNHTDTKGFSSAYDSTGTAGFDDDGFTQNNVQANLAYNVSTKFAISLMTNYGKYRNDLDAGAFTDDKDFIGRNTSFINSLGMVYKFKNAQLNFTNTLIDARRTLDDDSLDVGGFTKFARGLYKGKSFVSELFGNIAFTPKLSLTAGVQRIAQNTGQDYLSISSFGPYETGLQSDIAKATNYSLYTSLLLINLHGFNAEAGVRYNHHNIYGNNATYSFNPSYNIDAQSRVFVNISSAFKIPSLYQLYSEFGNKDLKPEESTNFELGVQSFSNDKRNSIRVVGFKRNIRQLIIFYTDPVTYEGKYINRDKQNDYGFEVESNISVGKKGSWLTNITYIDGEGVSENVKVKNLYRRPNFSFNSSLSLVPINALTIVPSFRFVGSRLRGEYDAGPATMPQYYNIDLFAAYNFTAKFRVFLDLRNITDQEYFDVVGYNSRRSNFNAGISIKL